MDFLLNCFEGYNDEKMGRHQKGRGSIVKCGETPFKGEVLVKITWDSLYDGAMETAEYMRVNIWCILDSLLDLLTKLQKFTSLAYSWSTSDECTKRDAVVAGRDGRCENLNPLQG